MKGKFTLEGRGFIPKIFDLKVLVFKNGIYQMYGEFPIDICSILNPNAPINVFSRTNEESFINNKGKVNYALSAKFIK